MRIVLRYKTDKNGENRVANIPEKAFEIIDKAREWYRLGSIKKDPEIDSATIVTLLRRILNGCEYRAKRVSSQICDGQIVSFDYGEIEKESFIREFEANQVTNTLNELCMSDGELAWEVLRIIVEANRD